MSYEEGAIPLFLYTKGRVEGNRELAQLLKKYGREYGKKCSDPGAGLLILRKFMLYQSKNKFIIETDKIA